MSEKVLVAMSGGVDSSVSLLRIIEAGYDPVGVTMKLWSNESINSNNEQDNSCCGIEEINGAKLVCDQFGVPHYTIDFTKVFKEEVVNNFSEEKLKSIIKILGEEKDASRIARNITKTRLVKKITKVDQLVEIIKKSKKKDYANKINPSTKTFQALRIFVNKEITELIEGVINATKILKPGGKILIVSFHSIEDKIVKYFFSNFSSSRSKPSRYFPENKDIDISLFDKYKNKIFKPSNIEIIKNPPSRSAKLRYATRSKNKFIYPHELVNKFKKYLDLERSNV